MPRTRSQRRADLATSLGEDAVAHILAFLPRLGAFPGRVYSLTGRPGAQSTERGGLSLKAILAPRRQAVLNVPDAYTMEEALAAARDGDVVLVTDDIELQAPIIAPAFHLIIAAATYRRYGNGFPERDTCRPGQQYLLGSTGPYIPAHPAVYVNTHAFPGGVSDHETTCAAVVAVGADVRLELRGIAFHGVAADDEWVEGAPVACAAVGAQDGADLVIENCWFSNLGTHSLRARSDAKVRVHDVTINRSRYGIRAEGDGTSLVVENSRFNGPNVCAVGARVGAHVDVRWCSIDRIYSCALSSPREQTLSCGSTATQGTCVGPYPKAERATTTKPQCGPRASRSITADACAIPTQPTRSSVGYRGVATWGPIRQATPGHT